MDIPLCRKNLKKTIKIKIGENKMELFYSLIGLGVVFAEFLLGDSIDWWFLILTFCCSILYHIISNCIYTKGL